MGQHLYRLNHGAVFVGLHIPKEEISNVAIMLHITGEIDKIRLRIPVH